MIIFTKFHEDQTKNVDLLLMTNFWMCLGFFTYTLFKVFNVLTKMGFRINMLGFDGNMARAVTPREHFSLKTNVRCGSPFAS